MVWNLFSSLDIRDNSKVAFLEKKSNNPNICLVIGSGFLELSILWNCTTVLGTGCVRNLSWGLRVCLSVNFALIICFGLRPACEIFVADCTSSLGLPLSSIETFLSTVTKWSNSCKKTLLTQSVVLITRYKSGTILFWDDTCQFFSKKCHFQIISDVQWWTKKNHPFLESTYQEWMSFAKIGDGPCYYLWNEICAGVLFLFHFQEVV